MPAVYPGFSRLLDEFGNLPDDKSRNYFLESHLMFHAVLSLPSIASDGELSAFIQDNPAIISLSVLGHLLQVPQFEQVLRPLLADFGIEYLSEESRLITHPSRYPVGHGPIETLWEAIRPASYIQVLEQAADFNLASRLSPMYVSALSADCERLAASDPLLATMRQRLVVEVVGALDARYALVDESESVMMSQWADKSLQHIRGSLRQSVKCGHINHEDIPFAKSLYSTARYLATPPTRFVHSHPIPNSFELEVPGITDEERQQVSKWVAMINVTAESSSLTELDAEDPVQKYRNQEVKIGSADWLGNVVAILGQCLVMENEAAGLQILNDARENILSANPDIEPAITYLHATLAKNFGVERLATFDAAGAMNYYTQALTDYCNLGLRAHVLHQLECIADLSLTSDMEVIVFLVNCFFLIELELELKFGNVAMELMQKSLRSASKLLASPEGNTETLFELLQVAKGARYATALSAGLSELTHMPGFDWNGLTSLLHRIKAAEISEGGTPKFLNGMESLVAYTVSPDESNMKKSTSAYLRQEFDQMLEKMLVQAASDSPKLPFFEIPHMSMAQVQNLLDDRTVLVLFFLGRDTGECMSIQSMLITREECVVTHVSLEDVTEVLLNMTGGLLHPLAPYVERVRNSIDSQPKLGDLVNEYALQQLTKCGAMFFGDYGLLSRFRSQGKDHLCIVPHGPLHFFPFHLIGEPGKPLASEWVVSYLPNLYLLGLGSRRPKGIFDHGDCVAAFAASCFADDRYDELLETVDEVRAIAGIFETEPFVNEEFRRDELIAHLTSGCRYIHISSHGEIDLAAPSFHRILMGLIQSENDALAAYELIGYDLRSVDILTLSACDTALGRFDISDNIRGLPAFFFLAGVSTIVGTLWPVESEVARTFFTSFYRHLKLGKPKLEAFSLAQKKTQEIHPEYRYWGAFCYLGEWATDHANGQVQRSIPGIPGIRLYNDDLQKRGDRT